MTTATKPTCVVFRVWPNGDILALMPFEEHWPGFCMSYGHIGQHGGADYAGCVRRTKPAKPGQFADLLAELESIGYDVDTRHTKPATR